MGTLRWLANVPSVGHIVITAKSPFNLDFWKENVKTHPDPTSVQSILDGIQYSVKIGYDGPHMSLESDNWPSSLKFLMKLAE